LACALEIVARKDEIVSLRAARVLRFVPFPASWATDKTEESRDGKKAPAGDARHVTKQNAAACSHSVRAPTPEHGQCCAPLRAPEEISPVRHHRRGRSSIDRWDQSVRSCVGDRPRTTGDARTSSQTALGYTPTVTEHHVLLLSTRVTR
jgi:hypothetical protein